MRFTDEVGPTTLVKLMTDGICWRRSSQIRCCAATTRSSTRRNERSLNIDFHPGLPGAPAARAPGPEGHHVGDDRSTVASHFRHVGVSTSAWGHLIEPAPVIEVSGRTYLVEIRYRPRPDDFRRTPEARRSR